MAPEPARLLLAAPDSFKGTFSATEVARALAEGAARAGWRSDVCPVADGGEGTMDVLVGARGGELVAAEVSDPLGRPVRARFALLPGGETAFVEVAQASGLGLVAPAERDAERASSYGSGELIVAALRAGAREVLVAAGGSATTDGGAGALAAIEQAGGLAGASLTVLCDVTVAFEDAAAVFAPQKGADAAAVERLGARLDELAERLPRDPRGRPLSGCAGGLSGGLWAALGARLVPGAAAVLEAVGFDARAARCAAVATGEGAIDQQSLSGKVTGEIARRCRLAGLPLHAVVGRNGLEPGEAERMGLASLTEATTLARISEAGRALAAGASQAIVRGRG